MTNDIVFGIRPVIEAIEAGRQIEKVMIRKGAEGQLLSELSEICRAQRIHVQQVPVEKLNRTVRGNHQGVVAQISPIVYADVEDMLAEIPASQPALIVIFDGITDVRNFGGIARSAECAGAHGLIVPIKNSAPVNADAMKASAGALNNIPVCRVGSIRNTIKMLQSAGIRVVAASEKADRTLYDADMTGPTAIVMGSEEQGISKEVLKLCDMTVAIPQYGNIQSLNVSAAAAVMLFEAVRQRLK